MARVTTIGAARAVDALLGWLAAKDAAEIVRPRREALEREFRAMDSGNRALVPYAPGPTEAVPYLVAVDNRALPALRVLTPKQARGLAHAIPPVSRMDLVCRTGLAPVFAFLRLLLARSAEDRDAALSAEDVLPEHADTAEGAREAVETLAIDAFAVLFGETPRDLMDNADAGDDVDAGAGATSARTLARAFAHWLDTPHGDDEQALSGRATKRAVVRALRGALYATHNPDAPHVRAILRRMRAMALDSYRCVVTAIEEGGRGADVAHIMPPTVFAQRIEEPMEPGEGLLFPVAGAVAPDETADGARPGDAAATTAATPGAASTYEEEPAAEYTIVADEDRVSLRDGGRVRADIRAQACAETKALLHHFRRHGFLYYLRRGSRVGAAVDAGSPVVVFRGGHRMVGVRWVYTDPSARDFLHVVVAYHRGSDEYILLLERFVDTGDTPGMIPSYGPALPLYAIEGRQAEDIADPSSFVPAHWLTKGAPTWSLTMFPHAGPGERAEHVTFTKFCAQAGLDRFLASPISGFDTAAWGGGTFLAVRKVPAPAPQFTLAYVATRDMTVDTMLAVRFMGPRAASPADAGRIVQMTYPVVGWDIPPTPVAADAAAVRFNTKVWREQDFPKLILAALEHEPSVPHESPLGVAAPRGGEGGKSARNKRGSNADVPAPVVKKEGEDEGTGALCAVIDNPTTLRGWTTLLLLVRPEAVIEQWSPVTVRIRLPTDAGEPTVLTGTRSTSGWTWSGAGFQNTPRLPGEMAIVIGDPERVQRLHRLCRVLRATIASGDERAVRAATELRDTLRVGLGVVTTDDLAALGSAVAPLIQALLRTTPIPDDPNTHQVTIKGPADALALVPEEGSATPSWSVRLTRAGGELRFLRGTTTVYAIAGGEPVTEGSAKPPAWMDYQRLFFLPPDADHVLRKGATELLVDFVRKNYDNDVKRLVFFVPRPGGKRDVIRAFWEAPTGTSSAEASGVVYAIGGLWIARLSSGWELRAIPGIGTPILAHKDLEILRELALAIHQADPTFAADGEVRTGEQLHARWKASGIAHAIQTALNEAHREAGGSDDDPPDMLSSVQGPLAGRFRAILRDYRDRADFGRAVGATPPATAPSGTGASKPPHLVRRQARLVRREHGGKEVWRFPVDFVTNTDLLSHRFGVPYLGSIPLGRLPAGEEGYIDLQGYATALRYLAIQAGAAVADAAQPLAELLVKQPYLRAPTADPAWLADGDATKAAIRFARPSPTAKTIILVAGKGEDATLAQAEGMYAASNMTEVNALVAAIERVVKAHNDALPKTTPQATVTVTSEAPHAPSPAASPRSAARLSLPPDLTPAEPPQAERLEDVPPGSVFVAGDGRLVLKRRGLDGNDDPYDAYHRLTPTGRVEPTGVAAEQVGDPLRVVLGGSPNDVREIVEDYAPEETEVLRRVQLAVALGKLPTTPPGVPLVAPRTDSVHEAAEAHLLNMKRAALAALAVAPSASDPAIPLITRALGEWTKALVGLGLPKNDEARARERAAEILAWFDDVA